MKELKGVVRALFRIFKPISDRIGDLKNIETSLIFFWCFLLCQFFQDRAKYRTVIALIVPQYLNDSLAFSFFIYVGNSFRGLF